MTKARGVRLYNCVIFLQEMCDNLDYIAVQCWSLRTFFQNWFFSPQMLGLACDSLFKWTVPQLSIMRIYNASWSKSSNGLGWYCQVTNLPSKYEYKKAYFLFVINLITRSKKIYRIMRSSNTCGTMHYVLAN